MPYELTGPCEWDRRTSRPRERTTRDTTGTERSEREKEGERPRLEPKSQRRKTSERTPPGERRLLKLIPEIHSCSEIEVGNGKRT